jgi:hypothetical protein
MLSYAVVGYVWSIYWGYMFVSKAMSKIARDGVDAADN